MESSGALPRGLLFALGGIALWSTNALAGSATLDRLPVGIVVLVQCGTAAAALGAARLAVRRQDGPAPPLGRADRRFVFVLGGVGFGGTLVLQYVAFAHAPIVEANVIAYGWPMFAAVWLALTGLNRRSAAGLVFACIGFAGVGTIVVGGGDGLSGEGSALGYAAALGSGLCMAFYSVGAGRARVPALDAMLCGALAGALAGAVLALGEGVSWTPTADWLGAVYLGLGPCAAGYAAWSAGMARSAGSLAPIGYATPLVSTAVLLAAGREVSGTSAAVGGVLVLVCIVGVVASARGAGGDDSS